MKKPNLFIVWDTKCGTTSMYYYLSQHHDIYMSAVKEPNFFNVDHHREADIYYWEKQGRKKFALRNMKNYLELFPMKYKYEWEATPYYLFSKKAHQRIHDFNAHAKIIIMVREPIDFLRSLHLEYLYNKKEDQVNFMDAVSLDLESRRKNGFNLPKWVKFPSSVFYSERVKFSENIRRYIDIFPRESIHVIILDDLRNNPKNTLKGVFEFLEVDEIAIDLVPQNRNINIYNYKLWLLFRQPFFRKLPKYLLSPRWYNALRSIFAREWKRAPLHHNDQMILQARFYDDVKNLWRVLNRDLLTLWWYNWSK